MTRLSLMCILTLNVVSSPAWAEGDDFLDDAITETKSEKKESQPLFLIPLQPVWKTIEPKLIDDAVKNIAAELSESGGFKVEQYNPRLGSTPYKDPEPRLRQRWLKKVRMAENQSRKRRFSQAIKMAGGVVRQVLQNPEHLRDSRIYCRAMVLVAEGELRRGRRNKSLSILDMVASGCSDLFDSDSGAQLSDAFSDVLADAVAEVRRRTAGTLVVQADEPKAEVYLNGTKLGLAPLVIRNLPPGKHLLAVVKAGHKPFGKVVKVGSSEVRVQARLTKPLGGGVLGRIFTEMRANRISKDAVAQAAELLRRHGGDAKLAMLGGIAQVDAVIKVSMIAVNRAGQAVRLKPMAFDVDFLGLAPEMLGFTEKLTSLSTKFVGAKLGDETLVAKLAQPQQDAQPIKWGSLALGGSERRSLAQQGNSRGPLKRGGRKARRRAETSMNLDRKGDDARDEDSARRRPRRDAEPETRDADADEARDRRRARRDRPEPRRRDRAEEDDQRARGDAVVERPKRRQRKAKRDTAERPRRSERSRSRRSSSARIDDDWGVSDKPRRLRKRSRSRVNWPMIAGVSAVSVGVVGGGIALWYTLVAPPSAVNANITWTVPQ